MGAGACRRSGSHREDAGTGRRGLGPGQVRGGRHERGSRGADRENPRTRGSRRLIADLSGPEIGIPLALMQLEGGLLNKYTATGSAAAATRNIAALQAPVTAGGFSGAWQPLGAAITR